MEKHDPIYMVTMISMRDPDPELDTWLTDRNDPDVTDKDGQIQDSTRMVGWFANLDEATKTVENNIGDLHEYYYKYAMITTVPEGLYRFDLSPQFYEYDMSKKKYVRIQTPQCLRGLG